MAVDIKTLRIGSHILVNGKRERVRGMDEDNGLIVRFPAEYVMANEVEPIGITPELLTELGFEYKDKECWSHWWKGNFHLKRRGESPYWYYEGDISVQYLHELENLYYMIYENRTIPD